MLVSECTAYSYSEEIRCRQQTLFNQTSFPINCRVEIYFRAGKLSPQLLSEMLRPEVHRSSRPKHLNDVISSPPQDPTKPQWNTWTTLAVAFGLIVPINSRISGRSCTPLLNSPNVYKLREMTPA